MTNIYPLKVLSLIKMEKKGIRMVIEELKELEKEQQNKQLDDKNES
jgi:hypothetical protein